MKNTVIIICGPTASGKTSAAIEVAKHFNTKIISADSRQCYKELNIGVARPSEEELNAVEHFFIANYSVKDKVTANDFENFALEKAEEIFKTNPVVVMAGGTGLYIRAFCEGMDIIPEVELKIRNAISKNYSENGLKWLQSELIKKDPSFWNVAEKQNPQRLMRALEVIEATGKSILEFRKGIKKVRPFKVIKIAIDIPKEKLHDNIEKRVAQMFQNGLVKEVEQLLPFQNLNALQTVGYKEVFDFLNGKVSLEDAKQLIIKHTRQYAKRQMTWFKKEDEINWLKKDDLLKTVVSFC